MNSLDGLLPAGFDRSSCLSIFESPSYRKPSPHKPSSNLISRLRKYEDLHRRCGPHTEAYKQALKHLDSETMAATTESDCNYIVYIGISGLGNRILTVAVAFPYAILTDRVLLVHPPEQISDLFCEPFQNTSRILPKKFPVSNQFSAFKKNTPHSHGFLARRKQVNSKSETTPSYLYLHLVHDYDVHDKRTPFHSIRGEMSRRGKSVSRVRGDSIRVSRGWNMKLAVFNSTPEIGNQTAEWNEPHSIPFRTPIPNRP